MRSTSRAKQNRDPMADAARPTRVRDAGKTPKEIRELCAKDRQIGLDGPLTVLTLFFPCGPKTFGIRERRGSQMFTHRRHPPGVEDRHAQVPAASLGRAAERAPA